uniref:dynein light chain Tctex-type protein 2B isoform X2 n=1 Tax=Myxine glutinosa TaxID=7769 RepID=UPI00358E3A0C
MAEVSFLRPSTQHKFRQVVVKDCIQQVLTEQLAEKQYNAEETPVLTQQLVQVIREKVKTMGYDRYKIVAHVIIGERRGAGVRVIARCLWDSDTDNCAQDVFMNDSLFCVAAVFGCYCY